MYPTAQALARTYSDREYTDPWVKVQDYRRVQAYTAEHPTHGRVRVGSALELPASRVRTWISGGMPDPVHGIQSAIDHGWLDPDPDSDAAVGLIELLAHILAGGSVATDTYVPAVSLAPQVPVESIDATFDKLGVDTTRRHHEASDRATEIIPQTDASVLGRCLSTMGAPLGDKVDLETFPPGVWDVPPAVQRSFAQIYVAHRAITYPDKETMVIKEQRAPTYLDGLGSLLNTVTDEPVTVGNGTVTISAAAARALTS